MKKLTFLLLIALMPMMAGAQSAYKKASTTAATAKAMNPPTPNSLTKKIVMERRYLVNKANNYCYPATCFRMDNNLQLEIRYFNTDHYQGSYSVTRHGIYIAVGRCEDVNFDWNVKDCDYFDAWRVCAVTTDQWVNEKIEFDESGNVSYYMNGKYMGTHMFEMLKKLAGSKTVTFDINPYGWYTGQHHYMDDLKLTLPGKTISDNFNDGVIDSKIWQTPTNPSGVREEGGILKTEQVRTDWPYHLRTIALSLTGGSQNSSSNSTLAQKTTNSTPTQKATTSSATAQKRYHDVEFHDAKGKVKSIKTELSSGQSLSSMVEFTIDGKEKGATDVEYDNNGYRLSSKDISQTDGSTVTVKYTWKNDRVIKVFYSYYKNLSNTLNFTYNAKGEQIEVSDSGGFLKVQYSDYKYDARGNWISRKSSILAKSATETRTIVYY